MEQNFVEDIRNKTSLLKVVLNSQGAADLLVYLDKETDRQGKEIGYINRKLFEIMKYEKYDKLMEKFEFLANENNQKLEEYNARIGALLNSFMDHEKRVKSLFDTVDFKTDLIFKKLGLSSNTPNLSIADLFEEMNVIRAQLAAMKSGTAHILGVDEDELFSSRDPSEQNNTTNNTSARNSPRLPSSPRISKAPSFDHINLKDIAAELSQLKAELEKQKKTKNPPGFLYDPSACQQQQQKNDLIHRQMQKDIQKLEEMMKRKQQQNSKKVDFDALQDEIIQMKNLLAQQTKQLNDIQNTTQKNIDELNEYIQDALKSALKYDDNNERLEQQLQDLQSLFLNSLQGVKEQMDEIFDQFGDMATKSEVMNAFSELISPKDPKGTAVGAYKCKCLACGKVKPTVNQITDANLAEILNYHPLSTREIPRQGATVRLVSAERPKTARKKTTEILSPRRAKTSHV